MNLGTRHWHAENLMLSHEVPLLGVQVGVWCTTSAATIIEPFFNDTINSLRYVTHIMTLFSKTHPIKWQPKQDGA
jgi:hypothetical protein